MAEIFTKRLLSGSIYGKQIKITGTSTSTSVTIHTAIDGVANYDEIWLYATNSQDAPVELTLEWGGVLSPDDQIKVIVPGKSGLYLIIPGLILQNSFAVTAFASVVDVVMISGYVNRIMS